MKRLPVLAVFAGALLMGITAAMGVARREAEPPGMSSIIKCAPNQEGLIANAFTNASEAVPLDKAVPRALEDVYGADVSHRDVIENMEIVAEDAAQAVVEVDNVKEGEPVQIVFAKVGDGYGLESLSQCHAGEGSG
jgi:hypothetical protein